MFKLFTYAVKFYASLRGMDPVEVLAHYAETQQELNNMVARLDPAVIS